MTENEVPKCVYRRYKTVEPRSKRQELRARIQEARVNRKQNYGKEASAKTKSRRQGMEYVTDITDSTAHTFNMNITFMGVPFLEQKERRALRYPKGCKPIYHMVFKGYLKF